MPTTHDCPGGCGTPLTNGQTTCRPCWTRLPPDLRDTYTTTHRDRERSLTHAGNHYRAALAIANWLRDNPAPLRTNP